MKALSEIERLKHLYHDNNVDDSFWSAVCIPTPTQMRMHLFYKEKTLFRLHSFTNIIDYAWAAINDR